MISQVTAFFSLRRLRTAAVYALIFAGSGLLANLWMTREQLSGSLPEIIATDIAHQDVRLVYGQRAHEATLPSRVGLSEKPLLVYVFAEWCPVCKFQLPVISALERDYPVLGIAMQSGDSASVKHYVAEQNIDFSVVNDEDGRISRLLGVNGVPATFIVNQQGDIKFSTRGYATEAGLRSRLWLSNQSL